MTDQPLAATFPIILAGPSGAGKTTIRDALLTGDGADRFHFSVSMTTRQPRRGEVDRVDYHFVDRDRFERLIDEGGMLEHATVHGQLYGTPRANLDEASRRGAHLLLDIDVQGARQVREAVRDVVSIFLLPPSAARVLERLRGRGSETPEELGRRIASARAELAAVDEFDYVVVNDDLRTAVGRVRAIIDGEEVSMARIASPGRELARRITEGLDDT